MTGWIFGIVLIQLLIVSWIDIKTKKISNLWFLLNLAFSLVLHFILPEAYPWQWSALVFPLGWLIIGFLLFLMGIMGAGDSKFLASLFLIIPIEHQAVMLEKLIYATCVVGIVMLTFKISRDFKKIKAYAFSTYWKGFMNSIRSSFSFAPVILLAWILLGVEQWS